MTAFTYNVSSHRYAQKKYEKSRFCTVRAPFVTGVLIGWLSTFHLEVPTMTESKRVTTALLLAAGSGSRLRPLTLNAPKCLTLVGGKPILERLVESLRAQGIDRLIVVIGYRGDLIRKFLRQNASDMRIDYVTNVDYASTNNIYSLWLARDQVREPFLLVESDLVFETSMLDDMLQPDRIAISTMLPWMNGTTVVLDSAQRVTAFHLNSVKGDERQYKTVNLYSLSLPTWKKLEAKLGSYISQQQLSGYYEIALADMVSEGTLSFDAIFFDANRWYEIDTLADLREADKLYDRPRYVHSSTAVAVEPRASNG